MWVGARFPGVDADGEPELEVAGERPVRAMPWLVMAALELAILVAAVALVFWAIR